jgi:hypothetical protein
VKIFPLEAKETRMKIIGTVAAAALLACGATLALAQAPSTKTTPSDSPSKAQPGAPDQGPGKQVPNAKGTGTGGAAIGPPADPATPAPGNNPTGQTNQKQKSEQDDPMQGGKKQ